MAGFAAGGLGMVAPAGLAEGLSRELADGKTLNDEQYAAVTGLLTSPNRVNLVQGPAGAGKSSLLRKYDEGMRLAGAGRHLPGDDGGGGGRPAERRFPGQYRRPFPDDEKMQAAARGGRVVVDESSHARPQGRPAAASRLGKKNDLKFVFVGDPMQHGSVGRGGLHAAAGAAGADAADPPDPHPAPEGPGIPGGGAVALRGQDRRGLRRPRQARLGERDARRR